MDKFIVPEKYRDDFNKALDAAVRLESFTAVTISEELNISRLNAAILIGFMDKYGFLYPSAKNEVKTARISSEEWEAIGKDIEKYAPPTEEKAKEFLLTPVPSITGIYRKTVEVKPEGIMITSRKASMFIPADEATLPHFRKAKTLSRGFIYFGEERPKSARQANKSLASLMFGKKLNSEIDTLITSLIADFERKL